MKKILKDKLLAAATAARIAQSAYATAVSEASLIFESAKDAAVLTNNEVIAAFHVVVNELLDAGIKSGAIKSALSEGGFSGTWQTVKHWVTEWNASKGIKGDSGGGGGTNSETKAGANAGADEAKADTEPEQESKSTQTLRAKTINKISYVFAKALTARIGQLEKAEEIEFTKGELILTLEQQTVCAKAGQTVASTLSRKTSVETFAKALDGLCKVKPEPETETETEPEPEPKPETEPEPETVDEHVKDELEKIDKYLKGNSRKRETKPRKLAGAKK